MAPLNLKFSPKSYVERPKQPKTIAAMFYPDMPTGAPGYGLIIDSIKDWCGGRCAGGNYRDIAITAFGKTIYVKPGRWIIRKGDGTYESLTPAEFNYAYQETVD